MNLMYILAINPGATSTKIAVYKGNRSVFLKTIRHENGELDGFEKTTDQLDYRRKLVLDEVESNHIPYESVGVIIARGGLIQPIESGVYEVNAAMIADLEKGVMGDHASNLGGLIAHSLLERFTHARAYIADPVVVDEMEEVARISGHPEFERISIFHALNQKSVARTYAQSRGVEYEDLNLVIAHLGSGISVGAHQKGRVIDVNNALDGEGPFAPERSGTLPAALLQRAMAYQISKEIGAMSTVLEGEVDAILITGGMAHNPDLTAEIKKRVQFIAPVLIFPGEDEMRALAHNGSLLLSGKIQARKYHVKKLR